MPAEAISYTLSNTTQSYSTSPLNFSIRKELNEIGELSVELPFTSEINNKFAHGDTVELYRDSTLLFKGIIVEKELNKESKTIRLTILGEEVKLNWTLFSKNGSYRVQYDNIAADTIAGDILSGTGYSLAECPTTMLSMRFEYAQRWKALQKLADVLGKDLWLASDGVHISDKGSAKTLTYYKMIRKTENSEDIINKVHLLGTGDGINQYTATAEDTASQNDYGLRERAYILRDIENEDTLLLKAQQIITDNKDPVEYIEIEAPFTSDIISLDVGDTITINDSELGLSGDYRVKRLEIGPTTIRAELVNTIALLSDKLKEYYNGLESLGVYAQGATNLYSVQDSDNADPNHPLELKIYVPPEAIKINRVKLNLVIDPFRAYSKAIKGGGAGTVTSASGGGATQTSSASDAGQVHASDSDDYAGSLSVTLYSVKGYTATGSLTNNHHSDPTTFTVYLKDNQGKSEEREVTLGTGETATFSWSNNFPDFRDVTVTIDPIFADTLTINATGDGQHTHTVDIPAHTHDVTLPDHTHEIDFGIYEIDTGATVDIEVNGTVVKTGSTGETDLDITQYITTGWNTIKFTPSDLARIQASVFFQVFIQSR